MILVMYSYRVTDETVDRILMEMVEAGEVAPGMIFVDGQGQRRWRSPRQEFSGTFGG